MAVRIEATTNASGGTDVQVRELDSQETRRLDSLLPERPHSAARALLDKLRAGRLKPGQQRYERVEVGGEVFYVRRLDWAGIQRIHLETSRGTRILDLQQGGEELRAFTISCLDSCIYSEPHEEAKYFTQQEAAELVDSLAPEAQKIVTELSNACLIHNENLFPSSVWGRPTPEPSPSNPTLPEENETSGSLTSENSKTGGIATRSSEPLATSPTDSEQTEDGISSLPTKGEKDGPST